MCVMCNEQFLTSSAGRIAMIRISVAHPGTAQLVSGTQANGIME